MSELMWYDPGSQWDPNGPVDEGKLGPAARKKSATIKPTKDHKTGRFPMPDKSHASQALRMLGRAKGLSANAKSKIRARANKILSKSPKK